MATDDRLQADAGGLEPAQAFGATTKASPAVGSATSIRGAMVAASALHTGVLALLLRARQQREATRGLAVR